jgi:hypothetical protein
MRTAIARVLLLSTLIIFATTLGAQSPANWMPDGTSFLASADTITSPGVRIAPPAVQKSAGAALSISLVTTYLPLGIALATKSNDMALASSIGVLIGPSTGYWYAGSGAWKKGMVFRLVMGGVGAGGALLASQCELEHATAGCTGGALVMLGSATAILIGGIADIAKLPKIVRTENAVRLSVSPTVALNGKSMGMNATLRF